MGAVAEQARPSFSDRVMELLERIDFSLAESTEEREEIYRLRYDAYLREGAIGANRAKRFSDSFDDKQNAWIFGVYVDGQLASSIRLHVTIPGFSDLPASHVFSDILAPEIAAGKTIIDPTRFVTDQALARTHPELAYITVRIGWMAGEFFNADGILATVRAEHQAFYRRVFGHRPLCPPRPYPSLQKPISLMMLDYRAARERVHRRYPFFRSTAFERRMLFGRHVTVPHRTAA